MSVVRLDWVFAQGAISLARNMFMHYHALHAFFFFFLVPYVPALSLSLSFSLLLVTPKKSIPSKNLIRRCGFSSSSSTPFLPDSVQFRDEKAEDDFLRTFLTRQFIRNIRLFCLTFQTLLYPVHLALEDGLLYVRNPRGVPTCSFKNFTLTCTPLIPLYQGLLWYSKVHVS